MTVCRFSRGENRQIMTVSRFSGGENRQGVIITVSKFSEARTDRSWLSVDSLEARTDRTWLSVDSLETRTDRSWLSVDFLEARTGRGSSLLTLDSLRRERQIMTVCRFSGGENRQGVIITDSRFSEARTDKSWLSVDSPEARTRR